MHGSQAAHVPESYKRYLANMFRDEFDLFATPVAVEFRSDVNPFLKDKPKEKRGLKTSQKERRERRITKDRAKRPPKKKGRLHAAAAARRAAAPTARSIALTFARGDVPDSAPLHATNARA